jgi:hypothetical protein
MEVPNVCFAISSSTVCLNVLLSVLLLPRRNRSFRPRFLVPLLHTSCARRLCPFKFPLTTFSLSGPWRQCPLRGARMARQVIPLRAVADFVRDPPPPWIRFFSCQWRPTARCQCSDSFHWSLLFRGPLMHRYGGWLITLKTDLRRFLARRRLLPLGFHFF